MVRNAFTVLVAGLALLSVACGGGGMGQRPTTSAFTIAQAGLSEPGACYCHHATKYCATEEGTVASGVCW